MRDRSVTTASFTGCRAQANSASPAGVTATGVAMRTKPSASGLGLKTVPSTAPVASSRRALTAYWPFSERRQATVIRPSPSTAMLGSAESPVVDTCVVLTGSASFAATTAARIWVDRQTKAVAPPGSAATTGLVTLVPRLTFESGPAPGSIAPAGVTRRSSSSL